MSDEHNDPSHKTSGPGHEVDSPPTKELFNIVWGLGGLTLLSIATCAQLFYQQERDIQEERGKETSYQLVEYRKEMQERSAGNGSLEFKDSTGAIVRQKYRPLDAARAEVLSNPNALKASAAPAGWIHPDDIAAGGQGAAGTPAGTPAGLHRAPARRAPKVSRRPPAPCRTRSASPRSCPPAPVRSTPHRPSRSTRRRSRRPRRPRRSRRQIRPRRPRRRSQTTTRTRLPRSKLHGCSSPSPPPCPAASPSPPA